MKDIIEYLKNLLRAEYVGEYAPGHMGAKILRFRSINNSQHLVVKLVDKKNSAAIEDIEANFFGYNQIIKLGGNMILPPGFKRLSLEGYEALCLDDLGQSMREKNLGIVGAKLLWSYFVELVSLTKNREAATATSRTAIIAEVLSFVEKFKSDDQSDLFDLVNQSDLSDNYGAVALMLLDFTPDNLFLEETLSFIDPWRQENYLGHPAVSIGQFIALTKIYNLKDSQEIYDYLRCACLDRLPGLLSCSTSSILKALRLGETLQLTLSAYVRRESDPIKAEKFRQEAGQLWVSY